MKIISGFFSFLWRIWFASVLISTTLFFCIFIIYPMIIFKKDFEQISHGLRWWSKIIFYGSGLYYKAHYKEELDKNKQYIIVCNHTSLMDIMLMFIVVKQPLIFVGKAELSKLPIFGVIFNKINVAVDRQNSKSRGAVYGKVSAKLEEGKSVCIFPEGGVPDAKIPLDEFKKGAFVICSTLNVPMAVFTFCGMKKRVPYGYFIGGPGRVDVFLEEIIPEGTYNKEQTPEFSHHVRELILSRIKACETK